MTPLFPNSWSPRPLLFSDLCDLANTKSSDRFILGGKCLQGNIQNTSICSFSPPPPSSSFFLIFYCIFCLFILCARVWSQRTISVISSLLPPCVLGIKLRSPGLVLGLVIHPVTVFLLRICCYQLKLVWSKLRFGELQVRKWTIFWSPRRLTGTLAFSRCPGNREPWKVTSPRPKQKP